MKALTEHTFVDYVYRAIEAVLATKSVVERGLAADLFD
jgi:hypothetical protein